MIVHSGASTKERFLPLDLARGVAALLVALFHFQEYGWIKFNSTAPALAVPFFFILSGFVLSHSYIEEISSGRMTLLTFARARIARLWPLHMVTMLVMLLLWSASPPPTGGGVASALRSDQFTPLQFLESATLTHELLGGRHGFNIPSWSISVEFWCGLLVFALLACRSPVAIGLIAALITTVVAAGMISRPLAWPSRAYVAGLGLFMLGWALQRQSSRIKPWRDLLPDGVWWTFAVIALAAIIMPNWRIEGRQFIFYPIFLLLIATLCHARVNSPLASALMCRAGDWSYGIYLWHLPIICGLVAADHSLRNVSSLGLLGNPAGDVVFVMLTLAISAWSYRNIEVPAKRLLRFGALTLRPA